MYKGGKSDLKGDSVFERGHDRRAVSGYVIGGVFLLTAVAALALLLSRAPDAGATGADPRPNVLFIVTDDQPYGTTGPFSNPWMDKLQKWFRTGGTGGIVGGTQFDNAYITNPLCCPSRASIMTGLYSHNHLLRDNGDALYIQPDSPVKPGEPNYGFHARTLQHHLKQINFGYPYYRTALFGKFFNFWDGNDPPPYFDEWSMVDNTASHSDFNAYEGSDPASEDNTFRCSSASVRSTQIHPVTNQYETTYLASAFQQFLSRYECNETVAGHSVDDIPWLAYVTPTVPHAPYVPEQQYQSITPPSSPGFDNDQNGNFQENVSDKPQYVQDAKADAQDFQPSECDIALIPANTPPGKTAYKACLKEAMNNQNRMLKSVDDMVDSIFTTLRTYGEEQDTLAFFISDNGMVWGKFWLNGKQFPYSQSVRTPLFMRWPNRPDNVPQNCVDKRLTANVDLATTALRAVWGTTPSAFVTDGRSLFRSSCSGTPPWERDRLLLEHPVRGQRIKKDAEGNPITHPDGSPVIESHPWSVTRPGPWYSILTKSPSGTGPAGYQYVEYYMSKNETQEDETPVGKQADFSAPRFREYYDMTVDQFQQMNLDSNFALPPFNPVAAQTLIQDRECVGGEGQAPGEPGARCP